MGSGIPYFPLDVDLDSKFKLIEAEFGITGFGVVVKIYQKIYGDLGYYIEWTEEVALLFCAEIRQGRNVVSEIVSAAVRRGIFDHNLHEKYSILTSKGIQERYFRVVERRKNVEVKEAYLLMNANNLPSNVNISSENANIQNENEDIPNQSTEEDSIAPPTPPGGTDGNNQPEERGYQWIVDQYHKFCPSLPKIKAVTDNRRRAMRSARQRLKEQGCTFKELFQMVEANNFLTGRSDRQWRGCGFDWILKPSNMQKILENTWPNDNPSGGDSGWKKA